MNARPSVRLTRLSALLVAASLTLPVFSQANWPAWRGPNANGVSPEANLPLEWSPAKNVRWRVELPDRGNSTPIVWGNQIFVTQAIEKDHSRGLLSFDLSTGKLLWQKGTKFAQEESTHGDNPYCAASPVTDGKTVVATYGSAGIFAYDFKGQELWHRDLGPQVHTWGNASSPVILGDRVFIYHGPGTNSAFYALNLKNGETLWRVALPEPVPGERTDGFAGRGPGIIGSFSTPVLTKIDGQDQLVISLPEFLHAFDPATGKELWRCGGLNPLVYTSPVIHDGQVLTLGGFMGSGMLVKPSGTGDITAKARVWHEQRARKGRIGSSVIKDGLVFLINQDGMAECLELATGKQVWLERLPVIGAKGDSWSSAMLAGDRVYFVNQAGETHVVRASRKFEVLASNALGEPTNSSLIVSGRDLLLRTYKGLWCISTETKTAAR